MRNRRQNSGGKLPIAYAKTSRWPVFNIHGGKYLFLDIHLLTDSDWVGIAFANFDDDRDSELTGPEVKAQKVLCRPTQEQGHSSNTNKEERRRGAGRIPTHKKFPTLAEVVRAYCKQGSNHAQLRRRSETMTLGSSAEGYSSARV